VEGEGVAAAHAGDEAALAELLSEDVRLSMPPLPYSFAGRADVAAFAEPWPLPAWPAASTTFLLCRQDRFLPAAFMRRVVAERLGVVPDEIDGGHMIVLTRPRPRPRQLADRLEAVGGPLLAGEVD